MRRFLVFLLLALCLPLASAIAQDATTEAAPTYRVVGYYSSYNIYERDYFVTDVPAQYLTHINYGPMDISPNGQCISADTWADTEYSYPGDARGERLRGNVKQLRLLRGDHPGLQVILSIGGWEFSSGFSDVALTPESRRRFAVSCVALMRQYDFDGLDIDWRYPVEGGLLSSERAEDSRNLTLLLEELRVQLDASGTSDERTYLLTLTAPGAEAFYRHFELENVHLHVDWINVTSYGYQGAWSELASHHAPLYGNSSDPRGEEMQTLYSVEGTVNAYLDAGIPASKIVIGVPLFAQTWRNVHPGNLFGLYQPASGVPTGTRDGGLLYYRDLQPLLDSDSYTRYFDHETRAPWLYNATTRIAVSYEDQESIAYKMAYIRSLGLGGAFAWELSYDDETGTLLGAIYNSLFFR